MSSEASGERCALCARELEDAGFCRVYIGARRVLCSPQCTRSFLRGAMRPAGLQDQWMDEVVEELRWTWGHHFQPEPGRPSIGDDFAIRAERGADGGARLAAEASLPNVLMHENRSCAY